MKNKNERDKDVYYQNAIDRKRNSPEWFGAIIRYFYFFGKKNFDTLYTEKELKKNMKIGDIFKPILIVIVVFICYLVLF